ncbi:hypothetical protein [Francisella sp. SYW-9]|uniref:hypothetical protein n=1 Tax=Francisella sp. SYW-9 TaxID=2610888 RepID=UPI00168CB75C|nr:hypothetical protein [Francisella sp. SYW-9]
MKKILIVSIMLVLPFTYATADQYMRSMTFTTKQNTNNKYFQIRQLEDRASSINLDH